MEKNMTTWNLQLLYKEQHDPQIEVDMVFIEKACTAFEKKYRTKNFTQSDKTLLLALQDAEKVGAVIKTAKPFFYFAFIADTDSSNTYAQSMMTTYEQRLTKAVNNIMFFDLKIGQIDAKSQKAFLSSKILAPYRYQLLQIFKSARYILSEKEEQLENLLSQPGSSMWVEGQEKLLNDQLVSFKITKIPITKAIAMLSDLSKKDRQNLYREIIQTQKNISSFAEAEINAVYTFKKIMDERRGYAMPYSATLLANENSEEMVEKLVEVVTKHFRISKRFYKLHAKLLKQKTLSFADRGAKIGSVKKTFEFDTAVDIVRKSFTTMHPKYAEYLDRFLQQGQIDVFPRKGKQGGGYAASFEGLPTFILLNHVDDIRSVETLAHEMGHAIHAACSEIQPSRYKHYSTSTAEVASTLFEQLVSDQLETFVSDKEKIVMLHNQLLSTISTIFRQIAGFNFELALHHKIRAEGRVSKEEIAKLLVQHMKAYMGDVFDSTEDDGYFFVSWSHMRLSFYVYTYAFGLLVSKALYANWKKDSSYETKIEQFLKAGKSMSPEDIFKSVGINVLDPVFFETGLASIDADITKLEKLAKKQGII